MQVSRRAGGLTWRKKSVTTLAGALGDEVEEASPHRAVGHVRAPDLIGDAQMSQQVGVNAVLRMRLAGLRRLVDRRQADLAHQPPDPLCGQQSSPDAADAPWSLYSRAFPEGLVDDAHQSRFSGVSPAGWR